MITPGATMTEPATAMTEPAATGDVPPISANPGSAVPMKSFARAISESLGGQQQSPRDSVSPSGPSKNGKKSDTQDPNALAAAGASLTVVLPLPVAQQLPAASKAPMQTTAGASPPAGKTSSNPLVALPAADTGGTAETGARSPAAGIPATRPDVATEEADFAKNPAIGASAEPHVASAADSSRNVSVPGLQPATGEPTVVFTTIGVAGTGSARPVAMMKSQGKVEEFARTGEKNLPRGTSLPDNGKTGAIGTVPRANASPATLAVQSPVASTFPLSALASANAEKMAPGTVGSRVETLSASQVTRVLADVSDAVVSFKQVGINSADVSLRPDKGTEINLHLSLNDGRVEVAARLEQGNFDSLNTRWADLQQSLAQQGIRVGQLDHASLNQNPGSNQHNNPTTFSQTTSEGFGDGQGRRPSAQTTDGVEESPVASTVATPRRAGRSNGPSPARRGWEMWA
jgi:hypothetical protein